MKSTEDLRLGKQYLKIRSYDKALEHLTKAVIQGDRAAVSLLYKLGVHFFDEKEYKKIVFADKETVAKQTVAVLFMSIFIGVVIAVLDFVMKFGLSFIL